MVVGAKPPQILAHAPPHRVWSTETFQMPPQNAAFYDWTTSHAPPEQYKGLPHAHACRTRANNFFKLYLINIIYNNIPEHPWKL